ncbi:MAG: hypothetical protein K1000chlam2_01693 [Chlamydiae bacterium]|nr:hypothetical protein [Chlamydiota bacterium]
MSSIPRDLPKPTLKRKEEEVDPQHTKGADSDLDQKITQLVKKQKPPSSPPPSTIRNPSSFDSPTPSISQFTGVSTIEQRKITDMFPDCSLSSKTDHSFDNVQHPPEFKLDKSYTIDGTDRLLIQQLTEKDCGITSFLMIYTDLIRTSPDAFDLSESYWSTHLSGGEYPSDLLCLFPNDSLSKLGVNAQLKSVDAPQKVLHVCKEHLKQTGHSIIAQISFPKIQSGHYIVIDKIDDSHVYLRDPYTALAYKVPHDTFMKETTDEELSQFSFFAFEKL